MQISRGNPILMGCNKCNGGYIFSVESKESSISLLLFDRTMNKKYELELDESMKCGDVFSVLIENENLDSLFYCYVINGRYYVDPYAKAITCVDTFGQIKKDALYLSPVTLDIFDWEGDTPLRSPYSDLIIYKLNVRGFTKSKTSNVKNKGTFAGIIERIPYLKELGITAVELQPAYEFDEIEKFGQLHESDISKYNLNQNYMVDLEQKKVNYWGYVQGFRFAPKASFCNLKSAGHAGFTDYTKEFKEMVKALHSNGIEVIMEMLFDKCSTGYILDCVRYWVTEYHIDGVHIYCDEASLKAVTSDPVLADTKIFTVCWRGERGRKKHIADYNSDFQNIARRFLKGDENMLGEFIQASKKNNNNSASINYIANNNGFTLNDLVSYDRKHNEANGENNADGEDFNFSWNCGEEGPTRKKKINELRLKQIKNALAMVILSGGTPLILSGDECGNSNLGNNNPYCIDGELSWVNWKNNKFNDEILEWTKSLIKLRKSFNILHMPEALTNSDRLTCGYPDISYHGTNAWYNNMNIFDRHIGIMYSCLYGEVDCHKLVYVAFNMHWESHMLALPKISDGGWEIMMSTSKEESVVSKDLRTVTVPPRSIAILMGSYTPDDNKNNKKAKLNEVRNIKRNKKRN